MTAPVPQAAFHDGAETDKILRAHYAKVYNFPKRLENLRARIVELRDEARELGYDQEAAHLAALAVFADCLPEHEPRQADWSGAEIATLKRLWLAGVLAKDIAPQVGRSYYAVRAAVKRFGLPKRRKVRA